MSEDLSSVHALIVAAGSGSRFGGDLPKQYVSVANKTLLEHSVQALHNSDISSHTLVVAAHDQYAHQLNFEVPCDFVVGGQSRFESVANGVHHLAKTVCEDDWIVIHDAARPCLHAKDLQMLLSVAKIQPHGAILGEPVVDTLKKVHGQNIAQTVNRESLWHAQTPQMFRLQSLLRAIEFVQANALIITDESQAFEQMGLPVAMVASRFANPKLTHPNQLPYIQFLLSG